MPTFNFHGRASNGNAVSGRRLAQSADNLGSQLMKEGIIPTSITLASEEANSFAKILDWIRGSNVTLDELAIFSRQMYTLTKAGVPLTASLRQLAENSRALRMSNALNGLVENLESGHDLASAMQEYPETFTPLMISMIRVGQNSGKLDEAFLKLNQYLEMETSTIKRIKSALRYPIFVLVAIIAAVILINLFVIPTFARVFAQSNIPLPKITQVFVSLSQFILHYWYLVLFFIGVIIFSFYRYLSTPEGKLLWAQSQLKIPIIGIIIKRIILLRFSQSFSVVVSSGVPIIEGLGLVAQTVGNEFAKKEVLLIQDSVQHGKSLTQSVAETKLFTPLELQMLSVSEETGELSNMLDQLGLYYRREVDYDLKRLSDMIEPVVIVGLAIVVLMLALSVYLPIWDMVKLAH